MTNHRTSLTPAGTTIAFIGLGVMGRPMASSLVRAGYQIRGYNRTASREPSVSQLVAARAAERECAALDAPVSGGEQGAIDATLSIMVGGEEETVARVAPIFEAIGRTIVHVGPSGSGQTVKAANQLIVAGNIQLVAEALIFLEAQKVDTTAALKVLSGGLAGSTVLERKGTSMIERRFEPGFRIALHDKDLGIYLSAARSARTATPLGALLGQLMATAYAEGDGGLDHCALLRLVERMSGRADR
jgi:2-hydroxy-3-oxopropionate reductase